MNPTLATYLKINSIFSFSCGAAMLLFQTFFQTFFHVPNSFVFPFLGANLIIFGLFVWFVTRRQPFSSLLVQIITGLDVSWVVASAVIYCFDLFQISSHGRIVIGVVAIWIGFLAWKQRMIMVHWAMYSTII